MAADVDSLVTAVGLTAETGVGVTAFAAGDPVSVDPGVADPSALAWVWKGIYLRDSSLTTVGVSALGPASIAGITREGVEDLGVVDETVRVLRHLGAGTADGLPTETGVSITTVGALDDRGSKDGSGREEGEGNGRSHLVSWFVGVRVVKVGRRGLIEGKRACICRTRVPEQTKCEGEG